MNETGIVRTNRIVHSISLAAALLLAVGATAPVVAQSPTCSTCRAALQCNMKIDQIFMNESGGSPMHYVRACGGLSTDVPTKHATLMTFPGNTHIDAVCIAARSPSGNNQPCELFYANTDPLTGHPDLEQGITPFILTPSGSSHQIIPVNWNLSGNWWIGVHFPAGACSLSEMGTRTRLMGAAAVWVSGGAWRDYNAVGAPGYGGNTPIIRPITTISAQTPPQVIVNTLGPLPLRTTEGGGSFDITVVLSAEPCDTVSVQVNVSDFSEATANTPLVFTPQNWSTPQTSTVTGVNDPFVDGDIPYTVTVESFAGLSSFCFDSQVTTIAAINEDDDVAGPNACPPPDVTNWTPYPPLAQAPPPLVDAAMAYDSLRERVVLFGGDNAGVLTNATYEWDGSAWTQVNPGGPGAPSPRAGAKMVFDSARGVCVLVGGATASGASDETWEWDGLSWTLVASGPNSPGGGRDFFSAAYDASRGVTVVYGGLPPLAETFEWNGAVWSAVTTPNLVGAGDRHMAAMTYDPIHQQVVLFGGVDLAGLHNDVWGYDGVDWTRLPTGVGAPTPRAGASFVFDSARNVFVVHGGDDASGIVTDDTWELDANALTWTQTSAVPPPRTHHAAAFDAARCQTVAFGGSDGVGPVPNETVTYPSTLSGSYRLFCVAGASTGIDWSWTLSGTVGGGWSMGTQNEPGLPAGSTADAIVAQWVSSINNLGCCTIHAQVSALSPQCFEVFTSDFNGFDLCVGAAGAPPTCCVAPGGPCSFNPTVSEVFPSGADCDGNGVDDAIDIAIDPALDANGNGILDSCQPYVLGDMNCDQVVNGLDIQGFVLAYTSPADYGATYPNCSINAADYNNDGVVNVVDLSAFIQDLK